MKPPKKDDHTDLDPVRRRILELLPHLRSNLRMASLAIGRNAAYLHQFIHRGTPRILAEYDREALAEHLGCRPEELKHAGIPPRKSRATTAPRKAKPARRRRTGPPKGYVAVPEIDVRAAGESGAWNEELEQTKEMWFLADRLIRHEFRAKAEDLRMVTADGDSMKPFLSSGDRILIDVSQRVPVPPGLFVIWDGMGLVAKRIEHVPHSEPPKVVIKSLNPEYDSRECLYDEVRLVGRAVWVTRRV